MNNIAENIGTTDGAGMWYVTWRSLLVVILDLYNGWYEAKPPVPSDDGAGRRPLPGKLLLTRDEATRLYIAKLHIQPVKQFSIILR